MAITALVLGILGLVLFVCPLLPPIGFRILGAVVLICPALPASALVLGTVALVRVRRRPERYSGKRLALAAIILGGIELAVVPTLLRLTIQAPEFLTRDYVASQFHGIVQGARLYARDHEGAFAPDLETLADEAYLSILYLRHPSSAPGPAFTDFSYVSGLRKDDPNDWIVVYSDPAFHWNEGAHIARLDGTVQFVKEPQFTKEIEQFKEAYEQARGAPPTIIAPH
jgi:hypothetical protein